MNLEYSKNNRNNKIVFILSVISSAIVAILPFFAYDHTINLYLYGLIIFVTLVLSFILAIMCHELGHMIFGLLDGYKLHYYQFFSFRFYTDENSDKLKFKFVKPSFLGQCIMKYDGDPLKQNYKKYMYGGALVNLMLFIILFIGFLLVLLLKGEINIYLLFFMYMNFYFFLSNGIPLTIGNIDNDAKNLIMMKEYDEAKACVLNSLKIQVIQDNNVPINEIEESLLNNNGMEIPIEYVNGYPFVLLRTIKKVMNNDINPYEELKEVYRHRNKFPLVYKTSFTSIILINNILEDREYRGIYYSKENKMLFKHPDKTDPLIQLIEILVKYKSDKINKDEFIKELDIKRKLINPKKLTKIEIDFISKFYDESLDYVLRKEDKNDENFSDIKRESDSEVLL